MTEKEKMLAGQLYQAGDPILSSERLRARKLLKEFNFSDPEESEKRQNILSQLLGSIGENIINPDTISRVGELK